MATRAQFRTTLLRRLGNRSASEITNADLDKWLDDGLADLTTRRFHLRALEKVGANITSVASQAGYSKPSDTFSIMYIEDTTSGRVLDRFPGEFREFLEAKQSATSSADNPPTEFIEFGAKFYVGPAAPFDTTLIWVPYYYARGSMAADAGASPNINIEWHYAMELVAFEHASRDLGDEERAATAVNEFAAWFQGRDTELRMQRRFNKPAAGVRPSGNLRSARTGV